MFLSGRRSSEWASIQPIQQNGDLRLSIHADEKYVYFLLENYNPAQGACIALDTLPGHGVSDYGAQQFTRGADFLLQLHPDRTAELLVHDNYSLLLYSMVEKMYPSLSQEHIRKIAYRYPDSALLREPSDDFHVVQRASGSIYSYMRRGLDLIDVGKLTYGNGNPAAPDFDSNADYCTGDGFVEIRLPWQLLNFRDPSHRLIVADPLDHGYAMRSKRISAIYAAPYLADDAAPIAFGKYPLTGWETPQWHERLKSAYYILQKEFEGANIP